MLKKYTAILMMFTACAIMLAHNIIPHHHHNHDEHLTGHHHTDQQHDDDADNNGLGHLFADLAHSPEGFSFTITHNFSNSFSKMQFSFVAVLPDYFAIDYFPIPLLLHTSTAERVVCISPHSHPFGLRAPPAA